MCWCLVRGGLSAELVAVTAAGMVRVGEKGLEVIVHRQVASGEGVCVSGGQPDDELSGKRGIGAVARPQLLADPGVDPGLG